MTVKGVKSSASRTKEVIPDKTRFVMSAPDFHKLQDLGLPEVAFAGRSNVGKSSLVGALMSRPKLVRTSRTPGRTQSLNLFVYDDRIAVVDLPGYGYAKLSKDLREQLRVMMRRYVVERAILRGLILILDARREEVTDNDREMVEMALQAGRPLLVVLSKIDLIGKSHRLSQLRKIEASLGIPKDSAVLSSAHTGEGLDELRRRLRELSQ